MNETYLKEIVVYKNDVVTIRSPLYPPKPDIIKPVRGDVYEFSANSRKRLAFFAANTDVVFTSFITLTYPRNYTNDGKAVKRHLRAFLQYLRRVDQGVEYLWWLEFQRRKAPHYHIITSTDTNVYDKQGLSRRWAKIASDSDPDHILAGTRVERVKSGGSLARYCVKYAMKMYQKQVPKEYRNVGRFWGCSRGVEPKPRAVHSITNEDDLRLHLKRWLEDNRKRSTVYKTLFNATPYLERSTGLTYNE